MSKEEVAAVELPLHEAVRNDDIPTVKRLLSSSPLIDKNVEDDNGITPLIEACISGNIEIVQLLLDAGCPAQPAAGFRHSPLRGATVCGNAHLIPLLLQAGADPNAVSDGNRTPLKGACFLRQGVDEAKSALCVKALRLVDG